MAERAAARGLRVGYEALAWGRHVNRWRQAWDIVRQADHPALGLIVDSFHTLSLGDDLAGIADVPAEKMFFVQLADAPKLSMDVLSWSRHFRCFPGQGELPVAAFLRDVLARRLSRAALAGDLQRRIPRRPGRAASPATGCARLILLDDEVRPAAGQRPAAPPPRNSTASNSSNSRWTTHVARATGRLARHAWASSTPACTAPSRSSCTARAASTWC